MSMPQVYLAERNEASFPKGFIHASRIEPFSSHQKAVTYLSRLYPKAHFDRLVDTTTVVDDDGSTVGWITKKFVQ